MMQPSAEKLVAELIERREKNSRYSERAFAKQAGISPGFLKLIFQGKRALSPAKAREVANRLGWSEREAMEFQAAVTQEKLNRQGTASPSGQAVENFAEISDWFHFAIVELVKTKRRITVEEIASRIGISTTEAQFSLLALARHGLIQMENGVPKAAQTYVVPAMSSSAIRKFHAQMLNKARDAIEDQAVNRRELRGLTLAFDTRNREEANAMIRNFMRRFEKKFSGGRPDKVYQLSLAFFSLENEEKT